MAENNKKIAAKLVGGTPLAFRVYPSGKWVVIAPDGRKLTFTAEQVKQASVKKRTRSSPKTGQDQSCAQKGCRAQNQTVDVCVQDNTKGGKADQGIDPGAC